MNLWNHPPCQVRPKFISNKNLGFHQCPLLHFVSFTFYEGIPQDNSLWDKNILRKFVQMTIFHFAPE